MRKTIIQLRRELWEAKASLIRTPLYMSIVLVVLLLIGMATAQGSLYQALQSIKATAEHDPHGGTELLALLQSGKLFPAHPEIITHGLAVVFTLFSSVLLLVLSSYLGSALYSDRQDKSILFWKSLPISESREVLTKLATAVLGAPLFYGVAALATGAFYLVILMAYIGLALDLPLPGLGTLFLDYLSSGVGFILGWLFLALWLLPIFCWLLFVSAAAKKVPLLSAIGAPLALVLLEGWFFGSFNIAETLAFLGRTAFIEFQALIHSPAALEDALVRAFSYPMAGGLIVSGAFLAGCIWLRKYRWEI